MAYWSCRASGIPCSTYNAFVQRFIILCLYRKIQFKRNRIRHGLTNGVEIQAHVIEHVEVNQSATVAKHESVLKTISEIGIAPGKKIFLVWNRNWERA